MIQEALDTENRFFIFPGLQIAYFYEFFNVLFENVANENQQIEKQQHQQSKLKHQKSKINNQQSKTTNQKKNEFFTKT